MKRTKNRNVFVKRIREYLEKITVKRRPFIAFQIEPTSRCQLKCIICPRTTFFNEWESGDMPLSTYRSISDYFDRVQDIHLQGWGEPLLNPNLFDMIQIAKAKKCTVSLTTNGFNLTPDISERLTKEGLDIIAISIAGASKKTHERIRCGSHFEQLIENINVLNELKVMRKSKTPKIVLSYMMTKMNIDELPEIVHLSKDMRVNELVATNLDYTPTSVQDGLRVFSCNTADSRFKKIVDISVREAKKKKLPFRVYPLEMEEVIICEMNPLRIAFFSYDGCVSPCIYLNMTKQGPLQRLFCGSHSNVQKVRFGNITEDDFMGIWEKSDYREFRRAYSTRLRLVSNVYRDIEVEMTTVDRLKEIERTIGKTLMKNPVPEVCRTCYKAYDM